MGHDIESELKKLETIAPHFQHVLADPLSEISRERQKWLVAWSFVCILLSKRIVTLEKVQTLGFDFQAGAGKF